MSLQLKSGNPSQQQKLLKYSNDRDQDDKTNESKQNEFKTINNVEVRDYNVNDDNVCYAFLFTGCSSAGRSLWSSSVLSVLAYELASSDHRSEAVGVLTSIRGLAQLFASVPTGILLDGYMKRSTALKTSSVIGFTAASLIFVAASMKSYVALAASLATWGLYWGIANTSVGALLADSTGQGNNRTSVYTRNKMFQASGMSIGPIASLIMFALLGNQWSLENCVIIVMVGQLVTLPAIASLCFFKDVQNDINDSHPNHPKVLNNIDMEKGVLGDIFDGDDSTIKIDDDENSLITESERHLLSDTTSLKKDNESSISTLNDNDSTKRAVPKLIATSDLITGLASGMSISYFPIFFSYNLGLTPVFVQLLYVLHPLCTAFIFCPLGQRLSKRFGRCQVAIAYKFIGIFLMYSIIITYNVSTPSWAICILYVLRTTFMNSTQALTKSTLMDSVPHDERGKWTALESVNSFSWSGSALMGAFLVRHHGVLTNFAVTGALQMISTMFLVYIVFRYDVK